MYVYVYVLRICVCACFRVCMHASTLRTPFSRKSVCACFACAGRSVHDPFLASALPAIHTHTFECALSIKCTRRSVRPVRSPFAPSPPSSPPFAAAAVAHPTLIRGVHNCNLLRWLEARAHSRRPERIGAVADVLFSAL